MTSVFSLVSLVGAQNVVKLARAGALQGDLNAKVLDMAAVAKTNNFTVYSFNDGNRVGECVMYWEGGDVFEATFITTQCEPMHWDDWKKTATLEEKERVNDFIDNYIKCHSLFGQCE